MSDGTRTQQQADSINENPNAIRNAASNDDDARIGRMKQFIKPKVRRYAHAREGSSSTNKSKIFTWDDWRVSKCCLWQQLETRHKSDLNCNENLSLQHLPI